VKIQNIPETDLKRIVIVGGGFAGLQLIRVISKKEFQTVLIDRNNFHQFQPLFYQVATAGLEPSAISFPFRKIFQKKEHTHFRMAEAQKIDSEKQILHTSIGEIEYDYLVLSMGATTNFFGNKNIENHSLVMKSVGQALNLRNTILENYEAALNESAPHRQEALMKIVVVGGGPTGVELAGALAEMKKFILPKDYPELDFDLMSVYLLEGSSRVLASMSKNASTKALSYLNELNVDVRLNTIVTDYDGERVALQEGDDLLSKSLIWAAGISCPRIAGIPEENYVHGNRLPVNEYNESLQMPNVFVLGDQAYQEEAKFPAGHPQVAQTAIQQAKLLAKNLLRNKNGKKRLAFHYNDKGFMATVGRNLAVADLPSFRFSGFFAWLIWMFIHLMSIVGVKNRLLIFVNWGWNYLTYDQSLRLLIRPNKKANDSEE